MLRQHSRSGLFGVLTVVSILQDQSVGKGTPRQHNITPTCRGTIWNRTRRQLNTHAPKDDLEQKLRFGTQDIWLQLIQVSRFGMKNDDGTAANNTATSNAGCGGDKWQVNKKTGLSKPWFGFLDDDDHDEVADNSRSRRKRIKTALYAPPLSVAASSTTKKPCRPVDLPQQKGIISSTICTGQKVRKLFGTKYYNGTIIGGPFMVKSKQCCKQEVKCWKVCYDDGDREDLDEDEIRSCPADLNVRGGCDREKECQDATNKIDLVDKNFVEQGQSPGPRSSQREQGSSRLVTPCKLPAKNMSGTSSDESFTSTPAALKAQLLTFPNVSEEEVDEALEHLKRNGTFGLHTALNAIHHARKEKVARSELLEQESFVPCVGMPVRKSVGGLSYHGVVTQDARLVELDDDPGTSKLMWEVTFEEGSKDDMDQDELYRCRASRPTTPHPQRGRPLVALELFGGECIVSQEFSEKKWLVRSVDISLDSNATDKGDIMNIAVPPGDNQSDTGIHNLLNYCVPDFIWASLPCFTYSYLSGGKHRHVKLGEFEKTPQAHQQNDLFVKMAEIIRWAMAKRRHMIVVIENPDAFLTKMPAMKEFKEEIGLHDALVHYCAFGREDLKPTRLWTNDYQLSARLGEWTCRKDKCPAMVGGTHPGGCRNSKNYNAAMIPQVLAEEVADYVHSKFCMDRVAKKKDSP